MKNLTEVSVNECQTTKGKDFLKSRNKMKNLFNISNRNSQLVLVVFLQLFLTVESVLS
jgi:hypothetical protein